MEIYLGVDIESQPLILKALEVLPPLLIEEQYTPSRILGCSASSNLENFLRRLRARGAASDIMVACGRHYHYVDPTIITPPLGVPTPHTKTLTVGTTTAKTSASLLVEPISDGKSRVANVGPSAHHAAFTHLEPEASHGLNLEDSVVCLRNRLKQK
ncbi:BQ5605_C041g11950 [Microbotryum silenes-dioicae]|uniref:BQ5605_C041g11950 protein n=1 Tax=Microbotryum silenes-dioicae TaxID=796604 RepID=A0A2X0PJ58_9BASI|nr:BQ5605_C041g11950 [Microbotryum silenes-dioicae]